MVDNFFQKAPTEVKVDDLSALAQVSQIDNKPTGNQIIDDAVNEQVSDLDFQNKYGIDALNHRYQLKSNLNAKDNLDNNAGSVLGGLGDLGSAAAIGAASLAGGAVQLATGNNENVINAKENTVNFFQGLKSNRQKEAEKVGNIRDEIASQYYKKQLENSTNLFDKAKVIGSELLDSAKRSVDTPAALTNTVGSNIGTAGVAGTAVKGTVKGLTKAGVKQSTANTVATTGVLGVLGAGEANSQAYDEVINTPFSKLHKESEEFRELIKDGNVSLDEARKTVANQAGLLAAGINLPISAVLARFGSNKIDTGDIGSLNTIKDAGKEIATEIGEEVGVTASSNIAVKETANENKDVLEGVGASAGQAITGTGILATPSILVSSGIKGKEVVAQAIKQQADNVDAKAEKETGTSFDNLEKEQEELIEQANITEPTINNDFNEAEAFDKAFIEDESKLPESVKNNVVRREDNSINKISTVKTVAKKIINNDFKSEQESIDNKLYFYDKITEDFTSFLGNVPESISALPEDSESKQTYEGIRNFALKLTNNKEIQKALEEIQNIKQPEPTKEEVADIKTNQKLIDDTIKIAGINPEGVNETVLNKILELSDVVKVLQDNQVELLNVIKILKEESKRSLETSNNIAKGKSQDSVSKEITDGGGKKFSINQFIQNINSGLNNDGKTFNNKGQLVNVEDVVQEFKDFAQHMTNKYSAVSKGIDNPNTKINYSRLVNGKFTGETGKNSGNLTIQYNKDGQLQEGTRKFSLGTYNDAVAVVNSYNALIKNFGSKFNKEFEPVSIEKLHSSLSTEPTQQTVKEKVAIGKSKNTKTSLPNFEKAFKKKDSFKSPEDIINNISNFEFKFKTDKNIINNIIGSSRELFKTVYNPLNTKLNTVKFGSKDNEPVIKKIKNNPALLRVRKLKLFNIVDLNTNKLDTELMSLASLAMSDWIMNLQPKLVNSETELESLIFDEDGKVNQQNIYSLNNAKEDLAKKILKFWQHDKNKDVSESNTRGLAENLALEMIELVSTNNDIFSIGSLKLDGDKSLTILELNNDLINENRLVIGNHSRIYSEILNDFDEVKFNVGEPINYVPSTQKNRSQIELSKENKKLIKKANETAYYRNTPLADLLNKLGKESVNTILGFKDTKSKTYSKKHLESVEGKNVSLNTNWDNFQLIDQSVVNNNKDIDNTPVYFKHEITSVNRLQQASGGPQTNKLVRELYQPNIVELDLTNKDHVNNFWLTIAQGSELIKVEKKLPTEVINTVQNTVNDVFGKQITELEGYVTSNKLSNDFVGSFKEPIDAVTLNTLFNIARYNVAVANGDTKFTHYVPLESDGKTNGIINFLMNFSSGNFNESWLKKVGKGGVYVGSGNKTLNQHITYTDKEDMYNETSNIFAKKLISKVNEVSNSNPAIKQHTNALLEFISKFGDLDLTDDGDIAVDRSAVKNPLTVFIYGSGVNGVTDKVVNNLLNNFYEEISNLLNGEPKQFGSMKEFNNLIKLLSGFAFDKKGNAVPVSVTTHNGKFNKEFELTDQFVKNLKNIVTEMYTRPLFDSMGEVAGESIDNFKLIQNATQIQSLYAKDVFNQALESVLKSKRNSGELGRSELLSSKDYQSIIDSVKQIAPIFKNADITLDFSYTEFGESNDVLSSTLNDTRKFKASMYSPTEAGVKAQPFINIATGDGMMIQLYMNNNESSKQTLPVFDGVYIGATSLQEESQKVNRAVYASWQINNVSPVLESFSKFKDYIAQNKITLSKETNQKVQKLLKDTDIDTIENDLLDLKNSVQARINTLSKMELSVDQMAGASSSFYKKGLKLPEEQLSLFGSSKQSIIDVMNQEYNKEYTKLSKADKTGVETNNEKLFNIIKDKSFKKDEISLNVVDSIGSLLESDISKEQRLIALDIAKNIDQDYHVVFDNNNIDLMKNLYYPDITEDIHKGLISTKDKVIFIKDVNNETLLHELIHASTINKIHNYYTGSDNNNKTVIKALEQSMHSFMKHKFNSEFGAISQLKTEINSHLIEDTPEAKTKALNEFMAWSLSNRQLIEEGKKVDISSNKYLNSLLQKVYKLAIKLFGPLGIKNDLYSNVLMSTLVLTGSGNKITNNNLVTNHRISELKNKILNKKKRELAIKKDIIFSDDIKNTIDDIKLNGFDLNIEQEKQLADIMSLFGSTRAIKSKELISLQKNYNKVIKELDEKSFSKNLNDPNEDVVSLNKLNALLNINSGVDNKNIALGLLIGMSQISPEVKNVLSKIGNKKVKLDNSSVDSFLGSATDKIIDSYNRYTDSNNIPQEIEAILDSMIQNDKSFIEKTTNPMTEYFNKVDEKFASKVSEYTSKLANNLDSKAITLLDNALNKTDAFQEEVLSALNNMDKLPEFVKDLGKEVIGFTDKTWDAEKYITQVKGKISAVRQHFKEELPVFFNNQFKTKLSKNDWNNLTNVFAKTDIFSVKGIKNNIENYLNNPTTLTKRINNLEKEHNKNVIFKGKELANYMVNGIGSFDLLTNEYAILKFINNSEPTNKELESLGELISLYALELSDTDSIKNIYKDNKEAMSLMGSYLAGLVQEEKRKIADNKIALYNHYKGYIPSNSKDGIRIIIADDKQAVNLQEQGYTRISDYVNPNGEISNIKKGYYYSSDAGAAYQQGALQTVQTTIAGIDPMTGRTVSNKTQDFITGSEMQAIFKQVKSGKSINNLLPRFDENGELIAYERMLNEDVIGKFNYENQLDNVIASWRGRQAEEMLAEEFNREIIDELFKLQDKEVSDKNAYVNISKSDDPIHKEIWKRIPKQTKDYINNKFGEDQFYVRKDLVNNMLGYPNASATDIFTGNTRLPEEFTSVSKDVLKAIFGKNAFKYLNKAEVGVQSVVGVAKDLIVVKSVIVPFGNVISNVFQLAVKGVDYSFIGSNGKQVLNEINEYVQNTKRKIEIEAQLFADNSFSQKKKLEKELDSIKLIEENMSIKPLIDAGEFNTINEGLTEVDAALSENNFIEWMENQVNKLPEGLKTFAKYGLITKDTVLYKGLNRAVQYGDFISKGILYNDLVNNKNVDPKEALKQINNEFVNYNALAGRSRQYLESIGLMWFWNFKIRSLQAAGRMIKDNPLKALFYNLFINQLPDIGIGTPVQDNVIGSAIQDKLKYSVGYDMMFNSVNLSPWYNLQN